MGGKSQPDFGDIAAAQGEENREVVQDQIYANRPTQYTPWGYSKWTTEEGEDGRTNWSNTQGLTPELQDILNKQIAIQGGRTDVAGGLTARMQNEFGAPMNWEGLSPMGQVPTSQFTIPEPDVGDPNAYRQHAEDAMYNRAESRLNPRFEGERNAMEIKLRNQGLGPQDAAWKSAMQNQGRTETDAYDQATWGAVGAGRNESDSMFAQMMGRNQNAYSQALGSNQQNFNQSMAGSKYANQIRQQQLTESMQKRGFSLNEINALQSGQQVGMPQMPNFSSAPAAQPAPIYQAGVDEASAANAANPMNALIGAGGSVAGAYLGR